MAAKRGAFSPDSFERSEGARCVSRLALGRLWRLVLWGLLLVGGSAASLAQESLPSAGFRRVFVPERDLPAVGLRDFAPIDLQQLGFLLRGDSVSEPLGAAPWEPRLVEAVYVCRFEDRALVSDASMWDIHYTDDAPGLLELGRLGVSLLPRSAPLSSGSGGGGGYTFSTTAGGESQLRLDRSVRFWFSMSRRADALATAGQSRLDLQLPVAERARMYLALPANMTLQESSAVFEKIAVQQLVDELPADWLDQGGDPTDAESEQTVWWRLEFGGVSSLTLHLASTDRIESGLPYPVIVQRQRTDYLLDREGWEVSVELELPSVAEPGDTLELQLSDGFQVRAWQLDEQRLAVEGAESDSLLSLAWDDHPPKPGQLSGRKLQITGRVPLRRNASGESRMPTVMARGAYVLNGASQLTLSTDWNLLDLDLQRGWLVSGGRTDNDGRLRWNWEWVGRPGEETLRLAPSQAEVPVDLLYRLDWSPDRVAGTVWVQALGWEQRSSYMEFRVSPEWAIAGAITAGGSPLPLRPHPLRGTVQIEWGELASESDANLWPIELQLQQLPRGETAAVDGGGAVELPLECLSGPAREHFAVVTPRGWRVRPSAELLRQRLDPNRLASWKRQRLSELPANAWLFELVGSHMPELKLEQLETAFAARLTSLFAPLGDSISATYRIELPGDSDLPSSLHLWLPENLGSSIRWSLVTDREGERLMLEAIELDREAALQVAGQLSNGESGRALWRLDLSMVQRQPPLAEGALGWRVEGELLLRATQLDRLPLASVLGADVAEAEVLVAGPLQVDWEASETRQVGWSERVPDDWSDATCLRHDAQLVPNLYVHSLTVSDVAPAWAESLQVDHSLSVAGNQRHVCVWDLRGPLGPSLEVRTPSDWQLQRGRLGQRLIGWSVDTSGTPQSRVWRLDLPRESASAGGEQTLELVFLERRSRINLVQRVQLASPQLNLATSVLRHRVWLPAALAGRENLAVDRSGDLPDRNWPWQWWPALNFSHSAAEPLMTVDDQASVVDRLALSDFHGLPSPPIRRVELPERLAEPNEFGWLVYNLGDVLVLGWLLVLVGLGVSWWGSGRFTALGGWFTAWPLLWGVLSLRVWLPVPWDRLAAGVALGVLLGWLLRWTLEVTLPLPADRCRSHGSGVTGSLSRAGSAVLTRVVVSLILGLLSTSIWAGGMPAWSQPPPARPAGQGSVEPVAEGVGSDASPDSLAATPIIIPIDAAGELAGNYAYVPETFLTQLFDRDRDRESSRSSSRIQAARYQMRVADRGLSRSRSDELSLFLDVEVLDLQSAWSWPLAAQQAQLRRFLVNEASVPVGSRLRLEGGDIVWYPDRTGVHRLRIDFLPVIERYADGAVGFRFPILPLPQARLDLFGDGLGRVEVVGIGRLVSPLPSRFQAMLGPVDHLDVRWRSSDTGSEPSVPANPQLRVDSWLRLKQGPPNLRTMLTVDDWPSSLKSLEIEVQADWEPIGSRAGDARLMPLPETQSVAAGRRRYRLELPPEGAELRRRRFDILWAANPRVGSRLRMPELEVSGLVAVSRTLSFSSTGRGQWALEGVSDTWPRLPLGTASRIWSGSGWTDQAVTVQLPARAPELQLRRLPTPSNAEVECQSRIRLGRDRIDVAFDARWLSQEAGQAFIRLAVPAGLQLDRVSVDGRSARFSQSPTAFRQWLPKGGGEPRAFDTETVLVYLDPSRPFIDLLEVQAHSHHEPGESYSVPLIDLPLQRGRVQQVQLFRQAEVRVELSGNSQPPVAIEPLVSVGSQDFLLNLEVPMWQFQWIPTRHLTPPSYRFEMPEPPGPNRLLTTLVPGESNWQVRIEGDLTIGPERLQGVLLELPTAVAEQVVARSTTYLRQALPEPGQTILYLMPSSELAWQSDQSQPGRARFSLLADLPVPAGQRPTVPEVRLVGMGPTTYHYLLPTGIGRYPARWQAQGARRLRGEERESVAAIWNSQGRGFTWFEATAEQPRFQLQDSQGTAEQLPQEPPRVELAWHRLMFSSRLLEEDSAASQGWLESEFWLLPGADRELQMWLPSGLTPIGWSLFERSVVRVSPDAPRPTVSLSEAGEEAGPEDVSSEEGSMWRLQLPTGRLPLRLRLVCHITLTPSMSETDTWRSDLSVPRVMGADYVRTLLQVNPQTLGRERLTGIGAIRGGETVLAGEPLSSAAALTQLLESLQTLTQLADTELGSLGLARRLNWAQPWGEAILAIAEQLPRFDRPALVDWLGRWQPQLELERPQNDDQGGHRPTWLGPDAVRREWVSFLFATEAETFQLQWQADAVSPDLRPMWSAAWMLIGLIPWLSPKAASRLSAWLDRRSWLLLLMIGGVGLTLVPIDWWWLGLPLVSLWWLAAGVGLVRAWWLPRSRRLPQPVEEPAPTVTGYAK